MIKVQCRTNLDEGQGHTWPEAFACRPIIGDRVQADDSGYTLQIVSITHRTKVDYRHGNPVSGPFPILEIELNK
jgi:hypothetical protein